VCLLLALGMYLVFTRTRLGMMIRAGASNREMVQSLGIDIKFLYRVVFAAAWRWRRWPAWSAPVSRSTRAWAGRC
jgi:branched-subunit amino acid ABC-type transport system permease component